MGRVFKCTYQGKEVALKVVCGEEHGLRLRQEYERYRHLENLDCVASVVTEPVSLLNGLGCAICISPVGQAMSQLRPLSRKIIKKAFESLEGLHAAGVSHGDARLENLIVVSRSAKWIDFIDVLLHPYTDYVRRDWETIIRSILQLRHDAPIPAKIEEAIAEYLKKKDVDMLLDVVSHGLAIEQKQCL